MEDTCGSTTTHNPDRSLRPVRIVSCGATGVVIVSVKNEGLKEAYTEADRRNWTKQELEDYERASIKERDEIGRIEFAEKKAKEKALHKVAKNLKDNGVSVDVIISSTGLTKEKNEKL